MKKLIIFIYLLLSVTLYSQEKRLALVIGNSEYELGGVLRNPVNDAYAMKQALTQVGFEVMEYFNLDQGHMKRSIDDFGLKLQDYDVGLFFYAGHGIQANGRNYLIPVDANLLSENDVEYNCIDAGRILRKMEDADNRTNIIILDACRNNPFERSWTRTANGRGLASLDAPVGSILAYATAPGRTASDGSGMNGLYTSVLIKTITIPGLVIENVFKQVRRNVIDESDGTQTPWESTSLLGDFYFNNAKNNEIRTNTNHLAIDDSRSEAERIERERRDDEANGKSIVSYSLNGRKISGSVPKLNVSDCEVIQNIEIQVSIIVDRDGTVVDAIIDSASYLDRCIWNQVVQASKRFLFMADKNALYRQRAG